MANGIRVSKILLKSGDVIHVSAGVTAVVGPNNTGKSSVLREVATWLRKPPHNDYAVESKVVESVKVDFLSTPEDQMEIIGQSYPRREAGQYTDGQYHQVNFVLSGGHVLYTDLVKGVWGSVTGLGEIFGSYFINYLDAESRLGLTASVGSYDAYQNMPSNPLQALLPDRKAESEISALSERAFRVGITVNRYANTMVHLHAGRVKAAEGPSPQSPEYMRELNLLPLVRDQGDGMKAFIGMVMMVLTGRSPFLLIDEPEAFLHPPQARLFGRFLAEQAVSGNGTQILVATHSQDIVAGLTSMPEAADRTSLVRLTRRGNCSHVAQPSQESVRLLLDDPLMKYYDMISGLFSSGVILCEADSDCTYFRAALEQTTGGEHSYAREAHFSHAGGKARIAKAMRAFHSAAIPTAAIFDIDILQDDKDFREIVETVELDFDVLSKLRNDVVSLPNAKATKVRRAAARYEIGQILEKSGTEDISSADLRKLQNILRVTSGWKDLKTAGAASLSGQPFTSFAKLRDQLESRGVFILEQGELERLHPEIPQANKAQWLRNVLEDPSLLTKSPALPLLSRVSKFLEAEQTKVRVDADEDVAEPTSDFRGPEVTE